MDYDEQIKKHLERQEKRNEQYQKEKDQLLRSYQEGERIINEVIWPELVAMREAAQKIFSEAELNKENKEDRDLQRKFVIGCSIEFPIASILNFKAIPEQQIIYVSSPTDMNTEKANYPYTSLTSDIVKSICFKFFESEFPG